MNGVEFQKVETNGVTFYLVFAYIVTLRYSGKTPAGIIKKLDDGKHRFADSGSEYPYSADDLDAISEFIKKLDGVQE